MVPLDRKVVWNTGIKLTWKHTLFVAWNNALIGWEGLMLSMGSSHALIGEGNHHLTEWEGIMMSLGRELCLH